MRLIYAAIAWCAGIVGAAGGLISPVMALILFSASAASLIPIRVLVKTRPLALLVMIGALGSARYWTAPQSSDLAAYNNRGGATITGTVISSPERQTLDSGYRVRVAAETVYQASREAETSGVVLADIPASPVVRYGDRVTITGGLFAPSRYGNFSYADYLARGGVYSLMPNATVEAVESLPPSPFAGMMEIRRQASDAIARAVPEPEAGLLMGILLGDESGISREVEDDFAAVGAAHIVAISGFNMVVVSGVVTGILQRLNVPKRRSTLIALAVIAVYTVFVGASAAVLRAALMSGLLIMARSLRRKTYVPTSLAFAALIVSAINPLALWDVGFQLSFAAVVGIALFADPMAKAFDRAVKRVLPSRWAVPILGFLNEPLIVSLAATAATLPLTILLFGRASPVTLLVNLLIVPVQPLVLILGGLAVIASLIIPALSGIVFTGVFIVIAYSIDVVRAFAGLPYAQIEAALHPDLVATLFGGVAFAAIVKAARPRLVSRIVSRLRQRPLLSLLGLLAAGALILGIATWRSLPDGRLHVWLLDMGHAHAALIRTPGGAQMLIDGGRYPNRLLTLIGDRLPFYSRTLDLLVITHPDQEDTAALLEVTRRYTVGLALTNGQPNENPDYAALLDQIGREKVIGVVAGYTFDTSDGVRIEVLNPIETPALGDPFGESALAVRVIYGERSFLFPSDMSTDGQEGMLAAGINPRADVLVIPQHGRENGLSAEFLAAVQPQIGLLQFDPANRFGDPAPDTLSMLEGMTMYQTADHGTIHLISDGTQLWQSYEVR